MNNERKAALEDLTGTDVKTDVMVVAAVHINLGAAVVMLHAIIIIIIIMTMTSPQGVNNTVVTRTTATGMSRQVAMTGDVMSGGTKVMMNTW